MISLASIQTSRSVADLLNQPHALNLLHISFLENGYIEGKELDKFLRELISSINPGDCGPEVTRLKYNNHLPHGFPTIPSDKIITTFQIISDEAFVDLRETFMEAFDANEDNKIEISEVNPSERNLRKINLFLFTCVFVLSYSARGDASHRRELPAALPARQPPRVERRVHARLARVRHRPQRLHRSRRTEGASPIT